MILKNTCLAEVHRGESRQVHKDAMTVTCAKFTRVCVVSLLACITGIVALTSTPAAASAPEAATPALVFSLDEITLNEGRRNWKRDYTLRLATRPTGEVKVRVQGKRGLDLISDDGGREPPYTNPWKPNLVFTFTPDNWNRAKTLRAIVESDPDGSDETVTLIHRASGANYDSVTGSVVVKVIDDDPVLLDFSPASGDIQEGSVNDYRVRLNTWPGGTLTVTVSGASNGVTFDTDSNTVGNQNTLTFNTRNWGQWQAVSLFAADDANLVDETVVLRHSVSSGTVPVNEPAREFTVNVRDDDRPGLWLSRPSAFAGEGVIVTSGYQVRLLTQPSANVTVTIAPSTPSEKVHIDTDRRTRGYQNTLVFTPSNWDTAREVTVTVTKDNSGTSGYVQLDHTAVGGGYDSITADTRLYVINNALPAFLFIPSSLALTEGSSGSYRLFMEAPPSSDVTVTLSATGLVDGVTFDTDSNTDGNQNTLTFTTKNWNALQTVKVTAAEDANRNEEQLVLTHRASGGGYDARPVVKKFDVRVVDNDPQDLLVSAESLTVARGSWKDYRVRLATRPAGDVTVRVTGATDSVSVMPSTLTFRHSNWSRYQTVTVSAAGESSGVDETVTLTNTASGGGYDHASAKRVTVTVDDDQEPTLHISRKTITMDEGSQTTYNVRFAQRPSRDRQVVIEWDTERIQVSPKRLTFTTDNWNRDQTVTVTARDYPDDTQSVLERLVHVIEFDGSRDDSQQVAVNVLGGGTPPSRPTALSLTPGNASLTVRWSAPTANGGLALTDYDVRYRPTDASLGSGWKELDDSTWDTATTATITGLINGARYEVQVRAQSDDGAGDWSESVAAVPVAPTGPPTAVTGLVVAPGDNSGELLVRWTAASHAPNGYSVRWRQQDASTDALTSRNEVSGTSFTIANLTDGTPYFVRVDTYNLAGDDIQSGTGVTGTGAPRTPNQLPTLQAFNDQVADPGRTLNLDVRAADADVADRLRFKATSSDTTKVTVTPTEFTDYATSPSSQVSLTLVDPGIASVTVTVSDGTAEVTDTFVVTVAKRVLATPTLELAEEGDGELTMSWANVPGAGSYALQWKKATVTSWDAPTGTRMLEPVTSGQVIRKLLNGVAYDVRLRARAAANSASYVDSDWSQAVTGTPVDPKVDVAPTLGSETIDDQIWTVGTAVTLLLPSATGGNGTLNYSLTPALPKGVTHDVLGGSLVGVPTEVMDETTYTWRVTDTDGNRQDSDAAILTFKLTVIAATPSGPPTAVTDLVVSPGDDVGELLVRWTAASHAPNGYSVRWRKQGPGTTLSAINTVTGTSFTISNLDGGIVYVVSVETRNAADDGIQSGTKVTATGTPRAANQPPTLQAFNDQVADPDRTLNLDVRAADADTADRLRFKASSSDTTKVTVTPTEFTDYATAPSSQVSLTLVDPGTATVTVTVSDGTAEVADTFVVTVGKRVLATPSVSVQAEDGQLQATWAAVTGASSYEVEYRQADATTWIDNSDDTSPALIANLANAREYEVRVRAKAVSGSANYVDSSWSALARGTPVEADVAPSFAAGTRMENQFWTIGTDVNLTLPAATGGNGTLSYTLTPALPAGVTLDASTRTLSGAPTVMTNATNFIWRAADSDGNAANSDTATLTFAVSVSKATLATPTGLRVPANSLTRTGFRLTWDAVANASGYVATATARSKTVNATVTGTEAEFTGLIMNVAYDVAVKAIGNANYKDSGLQTISVTTAANQSPIMEGIANREAGFGTTLTFAVSASDAESDPLRYEAYSSDETKVTVTPKEFTDYSANPPSQVSLTLVGVGRTDVTVTVSDGMAQTSSSFYVRVTRSKLATPSLSVSAQDAQLTATWGSVANASSYEVEYREVGATAWIDNADDTSPALIANLANAREYEVRVRAKAGSSSVNHVDSAWSQVVRGTPVEADVAPSFASDASIASQTWTVGTSVNLTLPAATGGNGTVSYTLIPALPAGVTLDASTRTLIGVPTAVAIETPYTWRAADGDSNSADSDTATLTFKVKVDKGALAAPSVQLTTGDAQLTATWGSVANASSYEVEYREVGATAWIDNADDTSPALIANLANAREYEVRVKAKAGSSSVNHVDSAWSQVARGTPVEADVAPSFASDASIASQTWTVGTSVSLTLPAATGGNGTVSYTLTPALPAGVTLDASTRTLSGVPTAVAVETPYTWRAADGDSNSTDSDTATLTFKIKVDKGALAAPSVQLTTGDAQLTATWGSVANASSYEVEYREVGATAWIDNADDTSPALIANLANAREYEVRVKAKAGSSSVNHVDSAWSQVARGTPVEADVAPSFASDASIASQTWTVGTSVNLTLPAATGGNGTVSYSLTPALPAGVTLDASTRTLSGVPTAVAVETPYTWRAADGDSNSADSDTATLTFKVKVDKGALAAPSVQLTTGDSQLTATWGSVANASSYEVEYREVGSTDWIDNADDTSPALIANLANAREYEVRVRAKAGSSSVNHVDSDWSQVARGTPVEADVAPSFASDASIASQTWTVGTSVNLTLPAATGGNGTVSYTLTPVLPTGVTLDASTRTLSGVPTAVAVETPYTWRAADGDSNSADSDTATLTFKIKVDKGALATPSVQLTTGDAQLTATWGSVANASSYEVEYREVGATAWIDNADDTSPALIANLANAREYEVRVRAKAGSSSVNHVDSAWSQVARGTPVEADVAPSFASDASIASQIWTVGTSVNLTLPAATGGNGTLSYTLTPALPAGVTLDASTRTLSGVPTAVAVETPYTWRAADGDSNSTDSDTATLTFKIKVDKGTLAAPSVQLTTGDAQLTATWGSVANASSYEVEYREVGATAWIDNADDTSPALIANLANAREYEVRVRAKAGSSSVNHVDSAWSQVVRGTPVEADVAPSFASDASIASQTWTVGTSVNLTLPAATGGNGTVSYTLIPALPAGVTLDASTRTLIGVPTAVAIETPYTWRAADGDSNSADSDTATLTFKVKVDKGALAAPTGLQVKSGTLTGTGFTVSWSAVDNASGYTAAASVGLAVVNGSVDTTGTSPEASFTGLEAGQTYAVAVVAKGNANYEDSLPETLTVTIQAPVSQSITAVTGLSVVAGDDPGNLLASWTAATHAPHGYSLRYRTLSGAFGSPTIIASGQTTSFTISALQDDTTYEVRIDSRNADGTLAAGTAVTARGTTQAAGTGNRPPTISLLSRFSLPIVTDDFNRLAANFDPRDADGDSLTYEAVTDNPAVATAQVVGLEGPRLGVVPPISVLVTQVGTGTVTVTFTASDGQAETSTSFDVLVPWPDLSTPLVTLVPGDGQLSVNWPDVVGAQSYVLQWKPATIQDWPRVWRASSGVGRVEPTTSAHVISDLANGAAYDVRVRARGASGSQLYVLSDWSASVRATPNTGPSLSYAASPATLTLGVAIDAMAATTSGFANDAALTYAVRPELPEGLTLDTTTGEISGTPTSTSTQATNVTVTVTADSVGAPTATANITFPAVNKPVLASPENLRLSVASLGPTGFTIYWNSVSNASGYRVTAIATGRPIVTVSASYTETGLEALFTDLAPGTTYRVTVRATGGDNYADSEPAELVVTTMAPSLTYTQPPATLTVGTPIPKMQANPSNFEGGSPIPSQAYFSPFNFNDRQPLAPTPIDPTESDSPDDQGGQAPAPSLIDGDSQSADELSYSVNPDLPQGLQLDPNTGEISGVPTEASDSPTSVIVTAVSGVGLNAPKASASITFPAIRTAVLAQPSSLQLKPDTLTTTTFVVQWAAVANATGYTATATTSGGTPVSGEVTGTEASFLGLASGADYRVSVTATGNANHKHSPAATLTVTTTTPSGPPTPVSEVSVQPGGNSGELRVSWKAASHAPNGYSVRWREQAAHPRTLTSRNEVSGTSFTITGLADDTLYFVRVDTYNVAGDGIERGTKVVGSGTPRALEVSNRIPTLQAFNDYAADPGVTRNLDVRAADADAGDTLRFKAASSDNTRVTVTPTEFTDYSANPASQVSLTLVDSGSATITVTVSDGESQVTDSFEVTVARRVLATPSLSITARDGQLQAIWAPVANAGSYEVEYRQSGQTTWLDSSDDTSPTVIVGLTNGQEYEVQVRAKAAPGSQGYVDSNWSPTARGTPVAADVVPSFAAGASIPNQAWTAGTAVNLTLPTATGGNGTLSYALTPHLPTGVTLDSTTNTISGAPTTASDAATYTWRVSDSDGSSQAADTAALTFSVAVAATTYSGPPTAASEVSVQPGDNSGELQVSWKAASHAPNGYSVRWREKGPGKSLSAINAVAATSFTISGLTDGITYVVRVDTYNAAGDALERGARAVGRGTPRTPDTPQAATNQAPTITAIEDQSATFGAHLAVDVHASDADGGDLRYKASSDNTAVAMVTPEALTEHGSNSQVTVTPVGAGTTTIRVTLSDGELAANETFNVTVSPATLGSPSLSLEAGDGQLTATWAQVNNAASYQVQYRESGSGTWADSSDNSSPAVIESLVNGTEYEVRVRARAAAGSTTHADGPWTTAVKGAPLDADVVPSFAAGATVPNQTWRVGETVNLVLPTATGGNGTLSYVLTPDLPTGLALDSATNTVSGVPTAASDAVAYTWRVSDSDDNSQDADSATVTFTATVAKGALQTPVNLALKPDTLTTTGFTVFWDAVANASHYTAIATVSGGSPVNGEVTGTEASFTGLEESSDYTVSVTARGNVNHEDSRAQSLSLTTLTPVSGSPTAVTDLVAVAGDAPDKLVVTWTAASHAPHGYNLRWRKTLGGSFAPTQVISSGQKTTYTITGLEVGTRYRVRLDTRNEDGSRTSGTAVSVDGTTHPIAGTTHSGESARVTDLAVATGEAAGELVVTWTAASHAPHGYNLRWRKTLGGRFASTQVISSGQTTTYTITGLDDGTRYRVRLDTRNEDGSRASGTAVAMDGTTLPALVIRVADAEGDEGDVLDFQISLSQAAAHQVTVRWRTESGTAQAQQDFESGSGDVTFKPGETHKTVRVRTLDDAHDDPGETFRVLLSNAEGAAVADGEALGTIRNDDPMPASWLTHFGRVVAEQALDGIARRIAAPRSLGHDGTLAGWTVAGGNRTGTPSVPAEPHAAPHAQRMTGDGLQGGFDAGLGNIGDSFNSGLNGGMGMYGGSPHTGRSLAFDDLLATSSFALVGKEDKAGRSLALWGRGSRSTFDAMENSTNLDGHLTTATLGADYGGGRWLAGLALSRTQGAGGYRQPGAGLGQVRATLGTAVPYASLDISQSIKLWTAAGGGSGTLTLTPEGAASVETDISWRMAAAGLRGDLLSPRTSGGPALAVISDMLWSRTESDRVAAVGLATSLESSSSATSRLRVGLEGSWAFALDSAGNLTPKFEAGVRRDGGNTDSALGVEVGAGLIWSAPWMGLTLDVSGRTLLSSGVDSRDESGFSAALGFDPNPGNARGLSLSLRQEVGLMSSGGLQALFAPQAYGASFGIATQDRWNTEAAYGFSAFDGRFILSPTLGFATFGGGRDYQFGWRLEPVLDMTNALDLSLDLRTTRRENTGIAPNYGVEIQIKARW